MHRNGLALNIRIGMMNDLFAYCRVHVHMKTNRWDSSGVYFVDTRLLD